MTGMGHADFVRLYRSGQMGVFMDDAVARRLVENHPAMPKRYHNAHAFWAGVWMVSGLISCGLIPLIFGIRRAINKSARQFVVDFALENQAFYDEAIAKKWFEVRAR